MTAEQLRKLAEIAGVYLHVDTYFNGTTPVCFLGMWQPHLNIEQAMMVAEAFERFEIKKHNYAIAKTHVYDVVLFNGDKFLGVRGFNGMLSEAICHAALAAKEE